VFVSPDQAACLSSFWANDLAGFLRTPCLEFRQRFIVACLCHLQKCLHAEKHYPWCGFLGHEPNSRPWASQAKLQTTGFYAT
jgi:hypothetical protein